MKYKLIFATIVSCLLAASSCSPINFNPQKEVKVTGVHLDVRERNLYVGDTYTFTPSIEPYNATNRSVTWFVSNTSVGSIENGTFTALDEGYTTVVVSTKDGGFTDTCEVQVSRVPDKVIDHVGATSSVLIYEVDDDFDRNTLIFTVYYTDDYYAPETLVPDNSIQRQLLFISRNLRRHFKFYS